MEHQPTSASDPESTQAQPSAPATSPLGAGGLSGTEATVDLTPSQASAAAPGGRPPLAEYTFLEPPRGEGEIGWLAHYRVRRLIGAGGMGLVFLAEDVHLNRPVALKVIRPELASVPEASARFAREARTAAAIKHDHIVTIYQVGQAKNVAYLAMEYLQGTSLQRWLERGKTPSIDLVLRIGREVAFGLAAAHKLGLIHRDIKPGNIWLEAPQGRVKILDFGQARAEREDVQITQSGAIMGTPAYMAPEQAAGEPATAASDLFSLGGMLYRLCTGQLPFQGKTILAVLHALASQTPPSPRSLRADVPESLDRLIMRLLAKNPADRPASAQEVLDTIRGVERQLAAERQAAELAPVPGPAPAPAPAFPFTEVLEELSSGSDEPPEMVIPRVATPPVRRSPYLLVGVACLALGVGVGGMVGLALILRPSPRVETVSTDQGRIGVQSQPSLVDPAPKQPGTVIGRAAEKEEPPPAPAPAAEPAPSPDLARNAVPAEVPPAPPATVAVGPIPAASSAPTPSVPESPGRTTPELRWGKFVDPGKDCKLTFEADDAVAVLQVPGEAHLLSTEHSLMNAPRLLQRVSGDFEVKVRVLGTDKASGKPTSNLFPPFHGAGILVWQDPDNYVRLEISSDLVGGTVRHYTNFEYRERGKLVGSIGPPLAQGATYLSLERRGNQIHAATSVDGTQWTPLPPLSIHLVDELQVGLDAINSATKPLTVRFTDYGITAGPASVLPPPG